MHAAAILAGVHGVPVAPAVRDHLAFHIGLGMRGLLPDEAPEPGQPGAAGRRYRVLGRACVTAPVYPADQDPGRNILAGPGLPKLRRAAKQRSGSVTAPGPVRQRPAGWSPFAGIARIRSLGVAVQPLSCPGLSAFPPGSGSPRHTVRSSSLDHLADDIHVAWRR